MNLPVFGSVPRTFFSAFCTGPRLFLNAFEITVRGNGNQQFIGNLLVDLKTICGLEELPYGGLRVVAWSPGAISGHLSGHLFDSRIENYAIAAHRSNRRVSVQLSEHVFVRVIAVETNQHALSAL